MLCCSLWFFLLHNTFFFPKDPLYYWQQTEDDLTVTIQLPEACTKEDIQVQFLPDSVNIVLKGQRFLEGSLFSSIDHESSTWIIKENNRYFFLVLFIFENLPFIILLFFLFILSAVVISRGNTTIGSSILLIIFLRID